MSVAGKLMCAILALLLPAVAFAGPAVTKVEPPNWWPDHTVNPLRILIHGSGLTGATVLPPKGLAASRVWVNDAGTYLFADIDISKGMTPGSYPLEIRTQHGTAMAPFRLDAPLPPAGRFQGFSPDDIIYLIMVDRFANGDSSNDDPPVSRGLFDRNKPYFYHGGDLQGIIDHLPYLKSLGITALWIAPVYDNTNEPNTRQAVAGKPIADYHGYGATDYYGVEEHFGNLALLRKLVDEAHRHGMKVIQDQVANHVGPNHPWLKDPPKPGWFHGTESHHINETWQIWTLPDINASSELKRSVLDGWFVNALPDMNQEDPDVAQYEIQNALWWVGETGFDGIRQDTLPYVPRAFWRDWSAALKRQYPDLRVVGEVFDQNPAVTSFFQGGAPRYDGIDSGIDTVFDFPAYYCIRDVFAAGKPVDTCAKTLAEDRLYTNPNLLVTFLGLHDVARFMNEKGVTVDNLKLALVFLMTMRGTPMLYYGDEIGMPGGGDPDNRRDFPGGWKDDPRNAFEAAARTPAENAVFNYIRELTSLRAKTEPLRHGKLIQVSVNEQTWVYARVSGSDTALIAINNGEHPADIPIQFEQDGEFQPRLRDGNKLKIQNGRGIVSLPARSAEIYTKR